MIWKINHTDEPMDMTFPVYTECRKYTILDHCASNEEL
jgi:hypothetical protein